MNSTRSSSVRRRLRWRVSRLALAAAVVTTLTGSPSSVLGSTSSVQAANPAPAGSSSQSDDLALAQSEDAAQISISTVADVARIRRELVRYIWKTPELPLARLPDTVVEDVHDGNYVDLASVSRIDRLEIVMQHSVTSVAYHFLPKNPNGHLFIFHAGHGSGFEAGKTVIASLLDKGYAVLAFAMPLDGMNSQPVVRIDRSDIFT